MTLLVEVFHGLGLPVPLRLGTGMGVAVKNMRWASAEVAVAIAFKVGLCSASLEPYGAERSDVGLGDAGTLIRTVSGVGLS